MEKLIKMYLIFYLGCFSIHAPKLLRGLPHESWAEHATFKVVCDTQDKAGKGMLGVMLYNPNYKPLVEVIDYVIENENKGSIYSVVEFDEGDSRESILKAAEGWVGTIKLNEVFRLDPPTNPLHCYLLSTTLLQTGVLSTPGKGIAVVESIRNTA